MTKDSKHTDKIIREKLEGFLATPPEHVWDNVHGQMLLAKKKKRRVIFSWSAAAAIVAIAFIAGWMLNEDSDNGLPEVSEQTMEIKNENESVIENEQFTEAESVNQNEMQATQNSEISKENSQNINQGNLIASTSSSDQLNNKQELNLRQPEQKYNLIETRKVEITREVPEYKQLEKQKNSGKENLLTTTDHQIIAANAFDMDKTEEDRGWIIGAHISPGYASHSSAYSNSYSGSINEVLSGGVRNTGGGLSIQYKTSKRLRIESGVYYAQNSQSSASSNRIFSFGAEYDMAYSSGEEANQSAFSNTVQVGKDGLTMNSTAGVVNIQSTPEGAEIRAAVSEEMMENSSATLVANGELAQVFDLVEVPFYLRYKLLDRKLGIDMMGGVNAGFVVGNNVYIRNNDGKQYIGNTADISKLNLSGTVGLGLNYAIGSHFSLAMEPRINYYLNSINTNPDVDYKPYRFGVFTGIYYAF